MSLPIIECWKNKKYSELALGRFKCVAPRIVLRQLEDQRLNLLGRARPADVLLGLCNFVRSVANPPPNGRWVDDRRKLVERRS